MFQCTAQTVPVSLFRLSEKIWQCLISKNKNNKVPLYWRLNGRLKWQGDTESYRRHRVSTHVHFQSHVHGREDERTPAHPTLPKHRLTWQIRACVWACWGVFFFLLTLQVSVTVSVRASRGFTSRQRNPKGTLKHPSCLSRLSDEAAAGSRSQPACCRLLTLPL